MTPKLYRNILLEEAATAVRERENSYGSPEESFDKTARLWSAYLGHQFTEQDVGIMMMLLKIARMQKYEMHKDNYKDIAGYAAITYEIEQKAEDIG